jgi:hypothetical protein
MSEHTGRNPTSERRQQLRAPRSKLLPAYAGRNGQLKRAVPFEISLTWQLAVRSNA